MVYRALFVGANAGEELRSETEVAVHVYASGVLPTQTEVRAICQASTSSAHLARYLARSWIPQLPDRICLVQELASYGDLPSLFNYCDDMRINVPMIHKLAIAQQVLLGLEALHSMHIAHGDVAARNVLVFRFDPYKTEEVQVKLTDFGLSQTETNYYMAVSSSGGEFSASGLQGEAQGSDVALAASLKVDEMMIDHSGIDEADEDIGDSAEHARLLPVPSPKSRAAAVSTAATAVVSLEGENSLGNNSRDPALPRLPRSEEGQTTHIPVRWAAPETLQRNKCHPGSDVWAFGVLLWELFTECEHEPWYFLEASGDKATILAALLLGERLPQRIEDTCVPQAVYDVMQNCWKWRRRSRPTLRHLKAQLVTLHVEEAERQQAAWMNPGLGWHWPGITPLETLEQELQCQSRWQALSDDTYWGLVTSGAGEAQTAFWSSVEKLMLRHGRAGMPTKRLQLKKVQLVKSTNALRSFKAYLNATVVERHARGVHPEECNLNHEQQHRFQLISELQCETDMKEAGFNQGCRVILAWHGSTVEAANSILATRMSTREFQTRDVPFFGHGLYFTPEAEYAAFYAKTGANDRKVLLLCALIVDRIYPVTEQDYDWSDTGVRAAVCRLQGQPLQQGYDTHLVPIRCDRTYQVPAAGEAADFHEIVVKQEAQVLPLAWVEVIEG